MIPTPEASSCIPRAICLNNDTYRRLLLDVLVLRPNSPLLRINSALGRMPSTLGRVLDELLVLRRRRLACSGSAGLNPLALASKFKISVRLTTPLNLPDIFAPGNTLALTADPGIPSLPDKLREDEWPCEDDGGLKGGTWWCEPPGLGGTLEEGEGASTIHMRCERVAQSLATVWARVEKGVTWKTG